MTARPTTPATTTALLALALVAGCTSTPDEPEPNAGRPAQPQQRQPNGGRPVGVEAEALIDPRIEVELSLEWNDIPKDEQGVRDAEEIARWVTQRRNAVQTCLNNEPQALTQAVEILQEVTSRVPDSSKDRFLLSQCYFVDASYWWRMTDVTAWEMNRIRADRTEHTSVDPEQRRLTDAQVDARLAELKPFFEACLAQLDVSARRALASFTTYRQQRPDDKRVYDYMWKLHFFVQDFREARRWLELIIHEMDLADVPARDLLRQDYEALVLEIKEKMVDERTGEYTPIRPMMRDRFQGRRPGDR